VVKKLEKGETVACTKLQQKQLPRATKNQANNMNKYKGTNSFSHVVCTDNVSMSSKSKKRRRNERCFRCKDKGHFIASRPHMENKGLASPRMIDNKMSKEQTPHKVEHCICYNNHEKRSSQKGLC
jgi:hypothetical protein